MSHRVAKAGLLRKGGANLWENLMDELRRLQIDMNVGNLAIREYSKPQFWRDPDSGAEVFAWASNDMVSSSPFSGLQSAD